MFLIEITDIINNDFNNTY